MVTHKYLISFSSSPLSVFSVRPKGEEVIKGCLITSRHRSLMQPLRHSNQLECLGVSPTSASADQLLAMQLEAVDDSPSIFCILYFTTACHSILIQQIFREHWLLLCHTLFKYSQHITYRFCIERPRLITMWVCFYLNFIFNRNLLTTVWH